jgi:hypothetical protein
MSDETSRAGCPVRHRGAYVPPRFQQGPITTSLNLGPLASLPGSWQGTGFNAIWRPDNTADETPPDAIKRFLQLSLTSESFDFHVIPGVVPNRGLNPQTDLSLYGLHYLQRVSDALDGAALHIEPGLFMTVPASTTPANPATIARLASIPHGVTVLMQGETPSSTPVPGPPTIPPIFPLPEFPAFVPAPPIPPTPGAATDGNGIQPVNLPVQQPPIEHQIPEVTLSNDVAGSQSNGPYPASIPQSYVDDPNVVLRNAIAGEEILGTITINLDSTAADSEIANIPFLGNAANANDAPFSANAFVESARATFWIEWVRIRDFPRPPFRLGEVLGEIDPQLKRIEPFWPEPTYLQLQYSQVVILVFNKVRWPHVTVGTLTLSAG